MLCSLWQWQSVDPGVSIYILISEWLALSHGYKINILNLESCVWLLLLRIKRKQKKWRACLWVYVSRNVGNRSNKRWPDRKIIEKYCRGDNNLFWQGFSSHSLSFISTIRSTHQSHTNIRYTIVTHLFRYVLSSLTNKIAPSRNYSLLKLIKETFQWWENDTQTKKNC